MEAVPLICFHVRDGAFHLWPRISRCASISPSADSFLEASRWPFPCQCKARRDCAMVAVRNPRQSDLGEVVATRGATRSRRRGSRPSSSSPAMPATTGARCAPTTGNSTTRRWSRATGSRAPAARPRASASGSSPGPTAAPPPSSCPTDTDSTLCPGVPSHWPRRSTPRAPRAPPAGFRPGSRTMESHEFGAGASRIGPLRGRSAWPCRGRDAPFTRMEGRARRGFGRRPDSQRRWESSADRRLGSVGSRGRPPSRQPLAAG
jgi:hypothetical protein